MSVFLASESYKSQMHWLSSWVAVKMHMQAPLQFPQPFLDRRFSHLRANTQLSLHNPMCVLYVFLCAYRKIWYLCPSVLLLTSPFPFSHSSGYFCSSYASENTTLSSLTSTAINVVLELLYSLLILYSFHLFYPSNY